MAKHYRKCYNSSCNGSCGKPIVSRQVRIENNSIGRDGESAYEAYVRNGGTLTEQEWLELQVNNSYSTDNWT